MSRLLSVTGWSENFENNRTRDLKSMSFVCIPNKLDGDGYTELLDHPDGASHYGAWMGIVLVASKCPERGVLSRGNGTPHDEQSISRITRIPVDVLSGAIERLVEIGWLTATPVEDEPCDDTGTIPHHAAEKRRPGAAQNRSAVRDRDGEDGTIPQHGAAPTRARAPASPARASRATQNGTEQNGTEGKERNGTEQKPPSTVVDVVVSDPPQEPSPSPDDPIREVFAHYRTYHRQAHPKPSSASKEWRAIKARLSEGYTVDQLRTAIDGCHRSPFHSGENDRGQKYQTLELIVRDGSKVQQFIDLARDGPRVVGGERTQRNARAVDSYLQKRLGGLSDADAGSANDFGVRDADRGSGGGVSAGGE